MIPYNYIYLTNNSIITCDTKTKLVPYTKNKKIKNYKFDLNNDLYLKKIYNYEINNIEIPIYLLSNYTNEIKVDLKIVPL